MNFELVPLTQDPKESKYLEQAKKILRSQRLRDWEYLFEPSKEPLNYETHFCGILENSTDQLAAVVIWVSYTGNKICEIKFLAVSPDFKGRGFGSELVDHVKEWSKAKGFEYLVLASVDTAVHFYSKLRFRVMPTQLYSFHKKDKSIFYGVRCMLSLPEEYRLEELIDLRQFNDVHWMFWHTSEEKLGMAYEAAVEYAKKYIGYFTDTEHRDRNNRKTRPAQAGKG